jgi:Zn-dependent peptidase ImmA (M78 family)/predicted secreted protein
MPNRVVADAHTAAQRLHARLHTDYNRPVDIFAVVKQHGIWLASQPLSGGLYGFYLREGDATGIVVNADHPETLQRYTCAHELGHHILGHASHLDERDDIQGPVVGDQATELGAQAFAGAFLMPLQAVNRVLKRLGLRKGQPLDAADVYAVSRELDVSYSAAAWQLATLGKIPNPAADRWVKAGAAAAKQALRPGPPPDGDNRAALFLLDAAAAEVPVLCRAGDELRLRLPENAATGHIWRLTSPPGPPPGPPALRWDGGQHLTPAAQPDPDQQQPPEVAATLRLTQDHYLTAADEAVAPPEHATVGVPGIREFVFVAQQPGRTAIDATLGRPFEPTPVGSFSAPIRVAPSHLLDKVSRDQMQARNDQLAQG